MYFVYMIKSLDEKQLYIGFTSNPNKRLFYHNNNRGAEFTKLKKFKLVFLEKHPSLSSARQREIQIKKWSRKKKGFLIERYQNELETK
jgi:putative endonuclease